MKKKKYFVVEELDPESVKGFSELQKKHYLDLGYKPYKIENDRIKWLTEAQRVHRATRGRHHSAFRSVKSGKLGGVRIKRRRMSRIFTLIRDNWLILSLLAITAAAIFVVLNRIFF